MPESWQFILKSVEQECGSFQNLFEQESGLVNWWFILKFAEQESDPFPKFAERLGGSSQKFKSNLSAYF